ncbi:MAG: ArnT family glycosyltransferase [Candidatus Binatia bacterium]
MLDTTRRTAVYDLAGVIVIALVLRCFFFQGIYPSDQFTYSIIAHGVLSGWWWLGALFYEASTRWGFLLPTVGLYRFFGVSEVTSTAWPMSLSIGTVVVGYLLGQRIGGPRAGWLAAVLLAFFPLEVSYASQLMGDGPLSFWLLLALYLFGCGDCATALSRRRAYLLASGLALGIAYATKFVALLVLPFFLLVMLLRRRIEWQYLWIIAGIVAVIFVEMALFSLYGGNAFLRIQSILADQSDAAHAIQQSVPEFTALRRSIWTYAYWMFVDLRYAGVAFILLGVLLGWRVVGPRQFPRQGENTKILWTVGLWALTLFLVLSLYPIQVSPYVPLYKVPNYMLMFSAPLLVVTAVLLGQRSHFFQTVTLSVLIPTAVLCMIYAQESHRAVVDNSRALSAFARTHRDRPVYASARNVYLLRYFDRFTHYDAYRWYTTEKYGDEAKPAPDLAELHSAYVAVDRYFLFFDKDRFNFPAAVLDPPPTWRAVFSYQRQPHWLARYGTALVQRLAGWGILTEAMGTWVEGKLHNWSHAEPVIVYAVE